MRRFFLPTVAFVGALTCGCSRDTDRARDSARSFLSAMNRSDISAMQAVATKAARPNLASLFKDSKSEATGFTLGDAKVTEDAATVSVTLSDAKTGSVLLRREENEWRVYALRMDLSAGNTLTVDFEHPENLLGEAFTVMGKELGKGMEQAGRALGQALSGFAKGFAEGMETRTPSAPTSDRRN